MFYPEVNQNNTARLVDMTTKMIYYYVKYEQSLFYENKFLLSYIWTILLTPQNKTIF